MKTKRNHSLIKALALNFILLLSTQYAFAQELIKGDTSRTKWQKSIINVESVHPRKDENTIKDTLTGTAIFLNDKGKLYLVTTKKLLQANIYGTDQAMANDGVYLKIDFRKFLNLNGLSDQNSQKSAVLFSNDQQDIAVISLQKKAYKELTNKLLTRYTPISTALIDTNTTMHADDWLITYQVGDFVWPIGTNIAGMRSTLAGGASVAQIQYYDNSPYFTVKYPIAAFYRPGYNGGAITANDKLIGILRNATGYETNFAIINHPYYETHEARAVKAAYIIRMLRKLQAMEANPGFDN